MCEKFAVQLAIRSIEVVSAFVIEDLTISVFEAGETARHLVLTGPNGTGKSSILLGLNEAVRQWPNTPVQQLDRVFQQLKTYGEAATHSVDSRQHSQLLNARSNLSRQAASLRLGPLVEPTFEGIVSPDHVHAYYPASRRFQSRPVEGPKRLSWPSPRQSKSEFSPLFLQHLVNRRSEQAFAREDGDLATADTLKQWFSELEGWLEQLMGVRSVKLRFDAKAFDFSLEIDGQALSFATLPDGFANILALWTDILLRVDAASGPEQAIDAVGGIVLIDEPEVHLHPELQEQLLPFLTQQFPGLQFIVATHSAMVATSLSQATVYDLQSQQSARAEELQGYRYGNILRTHFGLRTDFDSTTTAKLDRLFELHQKPELRGPERAEALGLARNLAPRRHLLAVQVLEELDDD